MKPFSVSVSQDPYIGASLNLRSQWENKHHYFTNRPTILLSFMGFPLFFHMEIGRFSKSMYESNGRLPKGQGYK